MLILELFYLLASINAAAETPTAIDRDITTNTVLTKAKSPYIITRDIKISAEVKIEPGVVLIFAPGVKVTLNEAIILAEGRPEAPIVIIGRGILGVTNSKIVFKHVIIRNGLRVEGVVRSTITMHNVKVTGDLLFTSKGATIVESNIRLDKVDVKGGIVFESTGAANRSIVAINSQLGFNELNMTGDLVFRAGATGLSIIIPVKRVIAGRNVTTYQRAQAEMYGLYNTTLTINDSVIRDFKLYVERTNTGKGAAISISTVGLNRFYARHALIEGPLGLDNSHVRIVDSMLNTLYIHGYGLLNGTDSGVGVYESLLEILFSSIDELTIRGESIQDNWVHEDWAIYGSTSVVQISSTIFHSMTIDGEKGGVGGKARLIVFYSGFKSDKAVYIKSVVDSSVVISRSCIEGGKVYGLRLDEGYVFAGENWWGSPNGPKAPDNPGGDGARIVLGEDALVDYGPKQGTRWLTRKPSYCVAGRPPVARFWFEPEKPYWGQRVTFYGQKSYDIDGVIKKYHWSFGDGSEDEGDIVAHSYSEPGKYNVTLTVVDDTGLSSSKSMIIEVVKRPTRIDAVSMIATRGSLLRMHAKLIDSFDNKPIVGRELVFYIDGRMAGKALTNRRGEAIVTVNTTRLNVGSHEVMVEFRGDKMYDSSKSSTVLEIVSYAISLVDYEAEPGSVKPGEQTIVKLKYRVNGEGSIPATIKVTVMDKSYEVDEILYPGINTVEVPVRIPLDAAQGNYSAVAQLYISGMLYSSTILRNIVSVKPLVSVSVENVTLLDTPVIGRKFRVQVTLANRGNTDARVKAMLTVRGIGSAESDYVIVPYNGYGSAIVQLPVPSTIKPGIYTAEITVIDNSGKVVTATTLPITITTIVVEPRLSNSELILERRGLHIILTFANPESLGSLFLARLVIEKGHGNCVNVTACRIYDYARTVAIPAHSERRIDITVNLDSIRLEPLDTLVVKLLLYDASGSKLFKQYEIGRVPVIELMRKTLEIHVSPSFVAIPVGGRLDVKIGITSGVKLNNVTLVVPDNYADSVARVRLHTSTFSIEPGDSVTRWATIEVLKTAKPGDEAVRHIDVRLGDTTLAEATVKIKVPHVSLAARVVESKGNMSIVEVTFTNLDNIGLTNTIITFNTSGGARILDSEPGTHTMTAAVAKFDRVEPGGVAQLRIMLQRTSPTKINYNVYVYAVPEGSDTSFLIAHAKGTLAAPTPVAAATTTTPATATTTKTPAKVKTTVKTPKTPAASPTTIVATPAPPPTRPKLPPKLLALILVLSTAMLASIIFLVRKGALRGGIGATVGARLRRGGAEAGQRGRGVTRSEEGGEGAFRGAFSRFRRR